MSDQDKLHTLSEAQALGVRQEAQRIAAIFTAQKAPQDRDTVRGIKSVFPKPGREQRASRPKQSGKRV